MSRGRGEADPLAGREYCEQIPRTCLLGMEDPECLKLLGYRKRTEKEIIGLESDYMKALPPGHFRSLAAIYCSRRFRHLGALYYESKEECGEENHMGYVSLWSTLAVVVSSC